MRKFALLQRVVESCPLALWSIPPHHYTQSHIYIPSTQAKPCKKHLEDDHQILNIWSWNSCMSIGFALVPQPHCNCMHSIHKDHHQPRGKGTSEVRACHRSFVLPALTCHQHHSAPILFVKFLTNRKVVDLLILLTS
jgi:hypothetical protein